MDPFQGRRIAARIVTSRLSRLALVCAGLSLAPLAEAAGPPGHSGHGTGKPAAGRFGPGPQHGGHGASASDTPAVSEYKATHASMMRGMDVGYTGDPDVDFRLQMIPHHQGAIDMARVALRHAKDAWTRQLAESVIYEQQREIAEMQGWLARRGVPVPPGGQPRHTLSAQSFRSVPAEAGTRDELLGRSWAPGPGAPRPK